MTTAGTYLAETCKVGKGAECCRYVTMGAGGWECAKLSSMKWMIDSRVAGMKAKGDNCAGVANLAAISENIGASANGVQFIDAFSYPATPGFKDRDTSKEAARSMLGQAPLLRSRCLSLLAQAPNGLTADEAAARLDETVLAVRPRFTELQRDSEIEDTGKRRANESGRSAKVWRKI